VFRSALIAVFTCLSAMSQADPIRVATFNASLSRKGPGLLLRDATLDKDTQIQNVVAIIQTVRPDILLINEFDFDYEGLALKAFLKLVAKDTDGRKGLRYPHFYAPPQNTGVPSDHDLDGDGKLGGPGDAFGFGFYRGQYSMALVSRFPMDRENTRDFSKLLWKDFPNADMPTHKDGSPFPNTEAAEIMRLSSKGHWDVPITLPSGDVIHILASHPTPPVFDGPEDRNGKRNRDEILFWEHYIQNELTPSKDKFIVMGDLNADPNDGDGSHDAIRALLSSPYLIDTEPKSSGGVQAALAQGGVNSTHKTDPATTTADWRDEQGPGNLRVDYVLPSKTLRVKQSGVFWPSQEEDGFEWIGEDGRASSDHRLVWVDLE